MVKEAFPDLSITESSITESSIEPSPSRSLPGSIEPNPLLCQPCWEVPEPPTDLIFDDGEPLESNRHRIAMNVLIDSMVQAYSAPTEPDRSPRSNFFVGGKMSRLPQTIAAGSGVKPCSSGSDSGKAQCSANPPTALACG